MRLQNAVTHAALRPEDVRRWRDHAQAVAQPSMVVHLLAPHLYDITYLRNTPCCVGTNWRASRAWAEAFFGAGDYAMRVWLKPDRVAALGPPPPPATVRPHCRSEPAGLRRHHRRAGPPSDFTPVDQRPGAAW